MFLLYSHFVFNISSSKSKIGISIAPDAMSLESHNKTEKCYSVEPNTKTIAFLVEYLQLFARYKLIFVTIIFELNWRFKVNL